METLAYLHLSTAYEDSQSQAGEVKLFPTLNWKNFPKKASFRLLSLALTLAVVGTAGNALALGRGNSGSQVATLQRNLQIAGYYNGPVTGYYGDLTKAAVIRFQRSNGLIADGIAGSRTLAALEGRGGESPITGGGFGRSTLRRGSSGSGVTTLQQVLRSGGYYNGPITGYFGSLTESSVKRFQQANGLYADGVVGQSTKSALAAD